LLKQLQATQEDLQKKEDELKKTESILNLEKQNLDQMKYELEKRNARMIELQRILARKDSSVNSIRQKVSNALLGMENEGLSVKILNGKVYVSLEEKLLFKSASIEVEPKGVNALKKLSRVLDQNPDINITIEGHTDDVPVISSASMKDNWDLSVKRATSIVRILLDGSKIDPKRLIASGRGEFMPIDPGKTTESRQKNRRTEIILTPRIDELLDILNDH
jgi:chemotaxis protein MotB